MKERCKGKDIEMEGGETGIEREIERGMKTRRRTNGERHGEKKRDSAI